MSIATVVRKARAFNTRVSETVVNAAREVAQEIWDTCSDDDGTITKETAKEIGEGIVEKKGPRQSEWVAFAMAVQFGMVEALQYYPKTGDTLTRVKMFGLARALNKAADFTAVKATVDAFVKGLNAKSTGKGRKPTIGMAIGIIKNLETRARNIVAFRKDLAKLCAKHGITY